MYRSDVPKPRMCQRIVRCESSRRIEVRQANNKIFEVRIKFRPISKRLSRILRAKATGKDVEDFAPWTISKVLQESMQSV